MGLGVHYAHAMGDHTILQFYFAPVGDPALGPVAYPHRASAEEIPQAPLGHHWEDSTHVADEVVTAGVRYRKVGLEASGFYGSEPDENRWDLDYGPINSWSTRLSYFPAPNWSAQVGRLARPERQEPGDVVRSTASVSYTRPMKDASWSSSLIWGRDHFVLGQRNRNAFLSESVFLIRKGNFLAGRAELVDKDELFYGGSPLAGQSFRIGAYILGFTQDIFTFDNLETGLGANVTTYSFPAAIKPYYGDHPVGVSVYLRFRLNPTG